jgi:hypothetical protein
MFVYAWPLTRVIGAHTSYRPLRSTLVCPDGFPPPLQCVSLRQHVDGSMVSSSRETLCLQSGFALAGLLSPSAL